MQQCSTAYGVSLQRLSKAAETWLLAYHWPGNVRELSHLLERVVLLEPATLIDPESLARRCLPTPGPAVPVASRLLQSPDVPLHESERLTDALRQRGGNLARAARLLGMSRGGLRYRLHTYGLGRPPQHDSSPLVGEESGGGDTTPAGPYLFLTPVKGAEPPMGPSPPEGFAQQLKIERAIDNCRSLTIQKMSPKPTFCAKPLRRERPRVRRWSPTETNSVWG